MIKPPTREKNGFALLVVFLMAATVAITLMYEIPRVAFESQRNREEQLVERGEQYKRAVELYYRKTKTYPQKIEDLENTNNFRFLRRRYKDPLTGKDEWRVVHMGPAGLTDSLVEKMPGLDGDKKDGKDSKDGKTEVAGNTDPSGAVAKGPDDISAAANRTERDQRALMAQRGSGAGQLPDPNGPPVDPNLAFQQQQMQEYQRQQQLQQQQQQQQNGLPQDPNAPPQNPGAPPTTALNPGQPSPFGQQPQQQNQDQQQPQQPNPFAPPQQQLPFNNGPAPGAFPAIGSQNGPVKNLYQPGQLPFNPGNAIMRGTIPNPSGNVSNSQTGGFGQPFSQQQQQQQQQQSAFGGSGSNSNFNVPQAVRDQLTRPSGRAGTTTGNQTFGGGGIAGFASNAPGSGIKRYNERSKYKEWEFVFDYRKPAKGAQKGVTGVGGLKTTDNPQTPGSNSGFGNNNGGFGNSNGGFGNSSGSGSGGFGNSGFGNSGGSPRRP